MVGDTPSPSPVPNDQPKFRAVIYGIVHLWSLLTSPSQVEALVGEDEAHTAYPSFGRDER